MRPKIETRRVDSLVPYEENSKPHPQSQVDSIAASITRFGFNDPVAVWRGFLVEGHGRRLAAMQLGIEEVPCIVLPDSLSQDEVDLYRIAHNKIALSSNFDFAMLVDQMRDIVASGTAEFADMGFSQTSVDALFSMFDAEVPGETQTETTTEEAGLNFEVVWERAEDKTRFAAFVERVQIKYGGTPGKALSRLMADIVAGKVAATTMEAAPVTAENAGQHEW